MGTPETDPVLRTKVAQLREAHLRWNRRIAWALGISLTAGVVVGLGAWFIQKPIDRDAMMFGGVLAVGAGTFLVGCLLTRMISPKPDALCPQCGHNWKGSAPSDDWLTWKHCPGCSLPMTDDVGGREKP
jgi:hypothetical protein